MNLKNKIIWITGASSGIGEQLSAELSKKGAKLILSARRKKELERVKNQCTNPEHIFVLPFDLTQSDKMKDATQKAIEKYGRIDILINNGGVSQRSLAQETTLDVDRRIMEINYFGTVALSKAVLPYMLKQKSGHIVVNSSITGKVGFPQRTAYAASKHALFGFFDSLRTEVWRNGIDVSMVCFGFIRTNLAYNALTKNGTPNNKMDDDIAGGMDAKTAAKKMIKAIAKKKNEVYISGTRELAGVYLRRFLPKLYNRIVRLK